MIVFHHVSVTWDVVWTYLPVSLLYILSMTLGYVGLRYIELSISSPICNSSGALVAVLCLCTGALSDYNGPQKAVILCAVGLVCLGVVGLGVVEAREDDDLRRRRQEHANRKYAKSWLAICLPVAYCLLDAAGTFADSLVLERLNEDSANVAYELTFLAAGIGCLVYLLARREKFTFKAELPKYVGAACETVGQLFFIYALADEEHVMMLCTDHLGLLRSLRAVEPPVPEGKALMEALSYDRGSLLRASSFWAFTTFRNDHCRGCVAPAVFWYVPACESAKTA